MLKEQLNFIETPQSFHLFQHYTKSNVKKSPIHNNKIDNQIHRNQPGENN